MKGLCLANLLRMKVTKEVAEWEENAKLGVRKRYQNRARARQAKRKKGGA